MLGCQDGVHIKHILGHLAASQVAGRRRNGASPGFPPFVSLKMPLTMATPVRIVTSLSPTRIEKRIKKKNRRKAREANKEMASEEEDKRFRIRLIPANLFVYFCLFSITVTQIIPQFRLVGPGHLIARQFASPFFISYAVFPSISTRHQSQLALISLLTLK